MQNFWKELIDIGRHLTAPLPPHHRAYGSRTTAVWLIELSNVQQDPEALATQSTASARPALNSPRVRRVMHRTRYLNCLIASSLTLRRFSRPRRVNVNPRNTRSQGRPTVSSSAVEQRRTGRQRSCRLSLRLPGTVRAFPLTFTSGLTCRVIRGTMPSADIARDGMYAGNAGAITCLLLCGRGNHSAPSGFRLHAASQRSSRISPRVRHQTFIA